MINPMTDELTDKETLRFSVEMLAHNLLARGLPKEAIPYVVRIFKRKLEGFFERTEYDQTS